VKAISKRLFRIWNLLNLILYSHMDIKQLLDPSSTVLLVIDKQAGYFDRTFVEKRRQDLPVNSAETLKLIDSFIEKARSADVEVVWTKMVEDISLSPPAISEKMKADPGGVTTITKPGDRSFEIYGRVKPESSEKIITKYRYNAFSRTKLADYLKTKNIKTVIFVGGYASRCVLSSVVGANGEDLFCVIPKDLVLNQADAAHEVKTLYDIVNAIFGIVLETNKIFLAWEK